MGTEARVVQGDVLGQATHWMQQNRRVVTTAGALIVIAVGGAWFVISAKARKEAFASRELRNAQAAVAAGNVPLATSDLSRLVTTYRGTSAASEAAILLGQLRLTRGEPDSAIRELGSFAQSGPEPRFLAAAYNLLGAALEQKGSLPDAGEAYRKAAAAWPYDYLRAQSLMDAGRAFTAAGDSARAAAAYEQVLKDYQETPSALEARLRLGELRRGDVPPP